MPQPGRRLRLRVDATGFKLGDADDRGDSTAELPLSVTNREPTPVRLDVRLVIRGDVHTDLALPPGDRRPQAVRIDGYGSRNGTLTFSIAGYETMERGTIYNEPGAAGGGRRYPVFPEGSLAVSLEDHISGGKEVIDLPIYEPVDVELPPPTGP